VSRVNPLRSRERLALAGTDALEARIRALFTLVIASVPECGGEADVDAPTGDPGCIQANAIVGAYWPNGPGYCSGNTFVACDGNTAVPMDCGKPCFHHAVPRTLLVGCDLDEPNPLCEMAGTTRLCDGIDLLVCDGGKLFSRKPGACSTPPS